MFLNINRIYDEKNIKKMILLGAIMVFIGIFCLLNKSIGIKLISWLVGLFFLYGSWNSLKTLNELNRYASKKEINKYRLYCIGLFVISVLIFIFPKAINILLSTIMGIYIIYREILIYFNNKSFGYYRFTYKVAIKIIIGIFLIVSPLFLSKFLVSILSIFIIIAGINFLVIGFKLKNGDTYFKG